MPSYHDIDFNTVTPRTVRPLWTRRSNVSVTHIPYSDNDDVQSMGFGNWSVSFTADFDTEADLTSVQALADAITARELVWFDVTYQARLTEVSNARAISTGSFQADLTFERGGT